MITATLDKNVSQKITRLINEIDVLEEIRKTHDTTQLSSDGRSMTAQHTPGPWYVEQDGAGPYVCGQNQGRIASVELRSFRANGGPEDWANARLIAAAPELLAAAEWGLRFAELGELGEVRDTAIRDLRAAIAKATGE